MLLLDWTETGPAPARRVCAPEPSPPPRLIPHLWRHVPRAFGLMHRQTLPDALVKTGWWYCGTTLHQLAVGDVSLDCLRTLCGALHPEDILVVLPHLHPRMHRDHVVVPDYDRVGAWYASRHAELIVTRGAMYGLSRRFRGDTRLRPLGRLAAWRMLGKHAGDEAEIWRRKHATKH